MPIQSLPDSQSVPYLLPLKPLALADSGGFITDVTFRSPADHPDVCLIQANYNLACFDEQLFTTLRLPVPLHLNKAVRKRRAEYLASRALVRHALCRLGSDPWILANDASRAPLWPAGFCGSLSHSTQEIALLLAKAESGKLLGVDCEQVMRAETAEAMQENIITQQEKHLLMQSGLPFPDALTLAFSLKESLYKALSPRLRKFMSFSEAEIVFCAPRAEKVLLRLTTSHSSEFPAGREFTGRVERTSSRILSWIVEAL
ncbi:4'-phosphopantetheinyl transferase superfamily protein [Erwinia sp. P7711]|uniref:4'-phosphopantetheinyl transferase family protein n=1 Tax=Erwinia sp. P7711 TaxID=3141451 RepID=UPI003184FD03